MLPSVVCSFLSKFSRTRVGLTGDTNCQAAVAVRLTEKHARCAPALWTYLPTWIWLPTHARAQGLLGRRTDGRTAKGKGEIASLRERARGVGRSSGLDAQLDRSSVARECLLLQPLPFMRNSVLNRESTLNTHLTANLKTRRTILKLALI